MLPRPGDISRAFRGGPIGMYNSYPEDNVIANMAHDDVGEDDGLLFVIARRADWCFVLMSRTMKLGWVHKYDIGVGHHSNTVYHVK